jgi:hypothetical protein
MAQKSDIGDNRSKGPYRRPGLTRWEAAEEEISRLLAELLLDGYLVLNNIPFPYGNLDHLVIRPDLKTFLIETKSHHGTVTWNGKHLLVNKRHFSSNPIGQINRSIRWLRHMLGLLFGRKPWIVSVLVFPNADVLVKRSVKRINVLNSKDLLGFIRSYKR